MGAVASAFSSAFRDYVTDGMPGTGANPPAKTEARSLGAVIEAFINAQVVAATSAGGAFSYALDVSRGEGVAVDTSSKFTWRAPHAMSSLMLRASLATASASGDVHIDVAAGGTSLLSTPLVIDATETTSKTSAAPVTIATTDIADDAEIEITVTAAGSGAKGLHVTLNGLRSTFGEALMPFYVGNGGLSTGTTSTTTTAAIPSGVAADDIMVLKVFSRAVSGSPTANTLRPSGWTLLAGPTDEGSARFNVYWKRCDGSESGGQVVTFDADINTAVAQISLWRNCVASSSPFEAVGSNSGVSTVMTGVDVTTTDTQRLVVTEYMSTDNSASDPDTGWTEIYDQEVAWPEFGSFSASTQRVPAVATIAAESRTLTGSTPADEWFSIAYALVGAPG